MTPSQARKETILYCLVIEGQRFLNKRVLVKIRARETRVKFWAPNDNNR